MLHYKHKPLQPRGAKQMVTEFHYECDPKTMLYSYIVVFANETTYSQVELTKAEFEEDRKKWLA